MLVFASISFPCVGQFTLTKGFTNALLKVKAYRKAVLNLFNQEDSGLIKRRTMPILKSNTVLLDGINFAYPLCLSRT